MGLAPATLALIAAATTAAGTVASAALQKTPGVPKVAAIPGTKTSDTANSSLQAASDSRRRAASSLLSQATPDDDSLGGSTASATSALAGGAKTALGQ